MFLIEDIIAAVAVVAVLVFLFGFPVFIILACQKMADWVSDSVKANPEGGFDVLPPKPRPPSQHP